MTRSLMSPRAGQTEVCPAVLREFAVVAHVAPATITGRMPEGEKPYRVYRGGRVKGKLPGLPRPARDGKGGQPKRPIPQPRRRRRWATWFAVGFGVFLLFVTAWLLASYFSFRSGVSAANAR